MTNQNENFNIVAVVPLYKSPELLDSLLPSILNLADEARHLGLKYIFINDSPDHTGLQEAINRHSSSLIGKINFEFITNRQNLGFVKSSNIGFALALKKNCDLILINSDVILTPVLSSRCIRWRKAIQ